MLEMRGECERCGAGLSLDAEARICSFECTFCPSCADDMGGNANNTTKTGDLCWGSYNATLSMSGHAGELIRDDATKPEERILFVRAFGELREASAVPALLAIEKKTIRVLIHWQGGQHTELSLRKRKSGEHRWKTAESTLELMRQLAHAVG